MIKELKVILDETQPKSKNGSVFEELIGRILSKHQYEITRNVHVTGLEIDVLAKHKIRNEILYAECKAKEKPKSDEIKKIIFAMDYGVDDIVANYGYFIYTEELDRQAAGLKLNLEKTKSNITFIGPEKIFSILEDTGIISPFKYEQILGKEVTKLILAYSYLGTFYVPILLEGSVPQYFSLLNVKLECISDDTIIQSIQKSINEIRDLSYLNFEDENLSKKDSYQVVSKSVINETVTEVRESENWYDYTPASIEHFIGRTSLKRELKSFIENIRKGKTKNRIFYINGKSGWGKSSLIAELRGSSRNLKYWISRMFVYAVDTRSANTVNFVGLAFKKLISQAISENFLEYSKEVKIASPFNILQDKSVLEILSLLKNEKKVIVLVFDQFEDKF